MKILRTIETFYPFVCGPVNQAFQISKGLKDRGIESPVATTYCDVDPELPDHEVQEGVEIFRYKNQARLMRYCISLGMSQAFKDYDMVHSHNYRNFQSDMAFFFHYSTKNLSSLTLTDLSSVSKNTFPVGNPSSHTRFTIAFPSKQPLKWRTKSSFPPSWNTRMLWSSALIKEN